MYSFRMAAETFKGVYDVKSRGTERQYIENICIYMMFMQLIVQSAFQTNVYLLVYLLFIKILILILIINIIKLIIHAQFLCYYGSSTQKYIF